MNGNFQNNYNGGWNNVPFNGFSQGQFNYNHQQMPMQYNDNKYLPHQAPTHAGNMHLSHQMLPQFVDNMKLQHQTPAHYVDNKQLPHQMSMQHADNRKVPHQMSMQHDDNKKLPHQMPTQYVDNRQPHQIPAQPAVNRQLPHQMPMQHADNRQLPQPMPMQNADNRQLPHQMPTQYGDNRQLTHQLPKQYVDNSQLPHPMQMQYVANSQLSHPTPIQIVDNRQLPHQTQYVDNKQLPYQMPKQTQYVDNSQLPHPTQTQHVVNRQLQHQMLTQTHYVDSNQLLHQTPAQYVDNRKLLHQTPTKYVDDRQLPHQTPMQYVDKRQLPHQASTQYVDNRQLPHQMSMQHDDTRQLPHQMPTQYVDNMQVSHQIPTQHAVNSQLPHQMPTQHADNSQLPHQMSMQHDDNKQLPHQMPTQYVENMQLPHQIRKQHAENRAQHVDNRQLPHQMPTEHAENRNLPHQMPTQYVNNRQLPHQMEVHSADNQDSPHQTPEDHAEEKCLPPRVHCEICDIMIIPKCLKEHNNGKRHRRLLLELRQTAEGYADKRCLPQQMPEVTADKMCLPRGHCDICDVIVPPKCLEAHSNGKRHQRLLLELREQSMKHKTSNGEESRNIQDSQINPVVQPEKVPKFKKVLHPVANMNHEAQGSQCYKGSKKKRRKRKVGNNTDAKDHGFKHKIGEAKGSKYMKMNNGIRRPVKQSKAEVNALSSSVKSLVQLPELTPSSGSVTSSKRAPIPAEGSSFEPQFQHVSASLSQESKGKEHHKFQNTMEKNDQPQSSLVELNASTGSNKTESMSCNFAATAPPQNPATSQVLISPAVGSSFEPKNHIDSQREVTEAKEHHEIKNRALERYDHPDSILMEFHAPAGSDINTLIEDSCSDSGAIVIVPPQSPIASQVSTPVTIIETEMSKSKVHNEIQNDIVDSNDQQHLMSMEVQDPAGSITNNQTEVVNSDSSAIEVVIEPLASALPDPSLSSFEPLTEHGLHTEIEPEVSEAVAYFDSQHPTEETNIELLPSLSMEIDALSDVSADTESEDVSSQVEVEMDVVATESEITKLPRVSVCLTCGDKGFEETLVYCNKCEDCALHRYCLDGPVIFTEEVIWFCEDCEQEIVDVGYPDEINTDSEKGKVDDSIEDCATVVDPQPIADPIWSGSLQVLHKSNNKITRVMGHLSTLACPKVLEETRNLPNMISADLLQRSAVWPESFLKFGTNNLSIGLYFFPQNERAERYFDQLVDEMISDDLAIRATVEKAELLIFPSTMLPSQYKRFQSKYYLWGIFKSKQAANTIKDS